MLEVFHHWGRVFPQALKNFSSVISSSQENPNWAPGTAPGFNPGPRVWTWPWAQTSQTHNPSLLSKSGVCWVFYRCVMAKIKAKDNNLLWILLMPLKRKRSKNLHYACILAPLFQFRRQQGTVERAGALRAARPALRSWWQHVRECGPLWFTSSQFYISRLLGK